MRYRAVPDPDGAPISPLFNNRTLEFSSRSGVTHCWLRFWLPDVVLPMKVDELEVSLNISGPANRIELFGWDGREMISLVIWDDPIGRMEGRIRDPRVLKPDEDGSVRLGIYVGDPARQLPESGGPREGRAEWQIEDFRAELTGVVGE
jgi:hypothetical protein